jgi:hypothetical protein
MAAHGGREPDQLVDGLALHAQSGEQACDLRVTPTAGENLSTASLEGPHPQRFLGAS